jgi:F-type H+-transporting ATPase subunit b
MKRLHAAMLASVLVASAPALVWAAQQRAPHAIGQATGQTAGTAAVHEESAKSEEGKENEGPPKPINWFDFSNHEQPAYGAMLLNFALLLGMYYTLGKKPVAEALKARRATIAKEIEEATRMRDEAEARALKYQDKLRHVEVELGEARASLKAAGEADRDRIVREAEEKAARMERDAKFLVEQETKQMSVELTRTAVEMAMTAAEEILRRRITPADQERLAEDYLAQITKRPSGAHPTNAPPSMSPPPMPAGGGE